MGGQPAQPSIDPRQILAQQRVQAGLDVTVPAAGTTSVDHLEEDLGALGLSLSGGRLDELAA